MPAHVLQHYRPAGSRRRHLERHRAHHLLPARHRPRLSPISTRSAPLSIRSRASIRCPPPRASRRSSAGRICWWRSKPLPFSAIRHRRPEGHGATCRWLALLLAAAGCPWAQAAGTCSCGADPPGPPRIAHAAALRQRTRRSAPVLAASPSPTTRTTPRPWNITARRATSPRPSRRTSTEVRIGFLGPIENHPRPGPGPHDAQRRAPGHRRGQRRGRLWRQAVQADGAQRLGASGAPPATKSSRWPTTKRSGPCWDPSAAIPRISRCAFRSKPNCPSSTPRPPIPPFRRPSFPGP